MLVVVEIVRAIESQVVQLQLYSIVHENRNPQVNISVQLNTYEQTMHNLRLINYGFNKAMEWDTGLLYNVDHPIIVGDLFPYGVDGY